MAPQLNSLITPLDVLDIQINRQYNLPAEVSEMHSLGQNPRINPK